MRLTWDGPIDQPRQEGKAQEGIIPQRPAKAHEGLFFALIGHDEKAISVPNAIMRLNVSAMSIGITPFSENIPEGKDVPLSLM